MNVSRAVDIRSAQTFYSTPSELRERVVWIWTKKIHAMLNQKKHSYILKGFRRFLMLRKWEDFLKCSETSRKDQNPVPNWSNFWNTFEKNVQTRSNNRFSLILAKCRKIYKKPEMFNFSLKCSETSSDRETIIPKTVLGFIFLFQNLFELK